MINLYIKKILFTVECNFESERNKCNLNNNFFVFMHYNMTSFYHVVSQSVK